MIEDHLILTSPSIKTIIIIKTIHTTTIIIHFRILTHQIPMPSSLIIQPDLFFRSTQPTRPCSNDPHFTHRPGHRGLAHPRIWSQSHHRRINRTEHRENWVKLVIHIGLTCHLVLNLQPQRGWVDDRRSIDLIESLHLFSITKLSRWRTRDFA